MCAAPVGNQFWKARAKHGRDKIFSTPAMLWDAACEYFQWVEDNPLKEEKLFAFQGEVTKEDASKMRAMTIQGLSRFLHIDPVTWRDYREKEDFSTITREIEGIIYEQKLTGAAADLLNGNIIARELGLKDRQDVSSEDGTMTPKNPALTQEQALALLRLNGISPDK